MISRLDFNIVDTHDFKTIGIVDTSWYNPDIVIKDATIEIFPPGYTYAASPFFMTKALNIYNSNGLGLTKASCEEALVDLPDGLWKIKYSICPNDKLFIEKVFLKVDKIMCRYTQAFLNLDLSDLENSKQKETKRKIDEAEFYLIGAVAASNNKNYKLASDNYKKAAKILGKLEDGSCGC